MAKISKSIEKKFPNNFMLKEKNFFDYDGLSVIFFSLKQHLPKNSIVEFCVDSYLMNNNILSIKTREKLYYVKNYINLLKTCIIDNLFLSNESKEMILNTFSKAISTNNKLKTLGKIYRYNRLTDSGITTDLYMNELSDYSEKLKIDIIANKTLYHFKLTDLLTIISKSLLHYEEVGLIKPLKPKNPYTNLPFSKATLYNIFFKTMDSPILLPILFILITGCETTKPKVNLTPLDIQSMQSRSYEHGKDIVFPSVMSVFQDLGYSINSADINTGLITAESAANSDKALKFWLGITKVSQTKANAFIEEIGNETKVRINFVVTKKKSFGYGQTDREDDQILTPKPYQNAFEKIENAIFIRSSS